MTMTTPNADLASTDIAEFQANLNRLVIEGAAREVNQSIIDAFRASSGAMTGIFAGAPLLLLTTIGAKSGLPRTTPLIHTRDGARFVLLASKAGAPSNPSWYHNLLANPQAIVELADELFEATATVVQGAERDRLFNNQAAMMPNFASYQRQTNRTIPVVILERRTRS
jgi:deazaflavin-dependent oxidoreductase (nitroreductase family)